MIWWLLSFTLSILQADEPIKVAVIDTGLDLFDSRFSKVLCPSGHRDFTGEGISDLEGHGTHIAGLIKSNAGNARYCLIILKYYSVNSSERRHRDLTLQAFKEAERLKVDIVNYSSGGSDFYEPEYLSIRDSRMVFVVAAGNNHELMDNYYPATYSLPNMLIVGSLNKLLKKSVFSNFGSAITSWEIGENLISEAPNGNKAMKSGTSMATAVHTGVLLSTKKNLQIRQEIRDLCLRTRGNLRFCGCRP